MLDIFNGKNWEYQREKVHALNVTLIEKYNDTKLQGLMIDALIESLPEQTREKFIRYVDKSLLIELLLFSDKKSFCRLFIYLMLDIEEESLELKNIHVSFVNDFLIESNDVCYIRGCWLLDMLAHPKLESSNLKVRSELFCQYSKDALQ